MYLVKNFLLGNYPLAKTFWIIYFIPAFSYTIIVTILKGFDKDYSTPWVFIILFMLHKFTCYVAIWNSSAKYTGKKRWFYFARLYLAFDFVSLVVRLISVIPLLLIVLSK